MGKSKKSVMLREYFKCKECYMSVWEKRIAKHHADAHPNVSHEIFVDTFFDWKRPLYKCDCCSIKLELTKLAKHRRLAHRHKDNSFFKYKLPIIEYLYRNRIKAKNIASKSTPAVDLTSDVSEAEDGEIMDDKPNSKDQAVQCERETMVKCDNNHTKRDVADKCVGEPPKESLKSRMQPVLPAMKIGVECDADGFLELVLF